jgi:hypothetical protein
MNIFKNYKGTPIPRHFVQLRTGNTAFEALFTRVLYLS